MLLTRLWFIPHREFDIDELEHAHAAWSVGHGSVPYRDFFEHHGPALYLLLGPLYTTTAPESSIDAATRTLTLSRGVMWLLTLAATALTFRLAQLWQPSTTWLRAAIAAGLLTTSWQFLNAAMEIRPDVPAVVCLLVGFNCLFEAERSPRHATAWSILAGIAVALSMLFTQKTIFAVPGFLVAAAARRQPLALFGFLGGALLPLFGTGLWFVSHDAGMALVENAVGMNVRLTADRMSPFPTLLSSVARSGPLYLIGVAGAIVAARRGVSGPRAALLISLASLAAGIVVIGRVYDQYYLLLLPLLAVLGASLLVDAATPLSSIRTRVAVLFSIALLLFIAVSAMSYRSNATQIDDMRLVMARTAVNDRVLSGVPGPGTFRPHAWYYFFLSGPFASDREYAALAESMVAGRVDPRIVILDARVRSMMPPTVLDYVRQHYRALRGDIYERADR
jgi:uncharacterized metal-binding protein